MGKYGEKLKERGTINKEIRGKEERGTINLPFYPQQIILMYLQMYTEKYKPQMFENIK